MSAPGPGAVLRAVVGIAISVLAFVLVLNSIDPVTTGEVLRSAAPSWVFLVAAFLLIDLVVRAVRWRALLAPIRDVPLRSTFAYLLVGYLANNVLPIRLGELVRSHYVGDREGISRATALGTVVVERVLDLVVVVAIAAAAILVLSVRGVVASAVLVGIALGALLALALALGIVAHRLPGAERVARAAQRWPQLGAIASRLHAGLVVAGQPRTLFVALVLGVVAWGATLLSFAAAGQSIGVHLTIGQASLLASGVALASAIPSGPASLGTFELAAVRIGQALGVPADHAFAIALIVHAAILVLTSGGGVIALVRLGWRRDRSTVPETPAETTTADAAATKAPATAE